ncbi:MAG: glycosyltransferase [Candidatus Heimdallarchaeota archaeon]|nr:MAG: glycosyltransferase [Candidatus Heimdallarchaeota archaeon]
MVSTIHLNSILKPSGFDTLRIAIFSDSWVPNLNGVVISIINEVQSLRKKHEFAIFVPKLKKSKPFEMEGIPIYELRSFPFPPYPGYNIALPGLSFTKAIRKENFDLIHCHSPFSLGYGAILTARVFYDLPLLNTYHTDLAEYSGHLIAGFQAERFTAWFRRFAWTYIRWFYKYSNVVVTPSRTLQQALRTHGVKPPVYALPNMISSVFFKNDHGSHEEEIFQKQIRDKFGIKPQRRIILYCGRISYEKKLEVMLRAFKQVEKLYPNTFLLVVGDGPHLKMYKNQAEQLNLKNYAFTGFISHTKLPYIYRMGEFMVTPSDTETQGLTVIEAMSQRLPVIGVARGGVLDYIHEKNGILVPPGDSNLFAQAIIKFLENPELVSDSARIAFESAQKCSTGGFVSLLEKAFRLTMKLHESS